MERHTGTITKLFLDRLFGFIRARIRGEKREVFFHLNGLSEELEFDEQLMERRVSFILTESKSGLKAIDVRPAD